jgi:topoisomerase-4 subunit A
LPTGGIIVEERDNIRQAYATGRGGFRIRARWEREDLKQGQYQLVVTEIPYQVQKAKLVEKIAELVTQRKLPMLDDIRDESAEDIRLVLVPKSRNVEPELLMEALFRHSDLETKVSLNMNVLDQGRVPRVMSLKQVLQSFLAHRQDVLVRRSQHRLDNVRHRLEILEGYLAVYLNIDEVIRIIRDNDEPRPLLCEAFDLSDIQADAVLNMRLRSLRKLEEQKIREEHKKLEQERDELEALLASETKQWRAISDQIKEMRKAYAPDTTLGARRTQMGQAPSPVDVDQLQEVMTEKEPITVVISQKGWIRAMKGHGHKLDEMKFKEGDQGRFALEAYTTDKIMFIATNGRVYTLAADKLPSGRGFGEPLRLHIDLPNEADIIDMRAYSEGVQYLLVADDGRGFVVKSDDMIAQTKNGKHVMKPGQGSKCAICRRIDDREDHLAIIGTNRKMLVFTLEEVPEMARGKGVILQKYRDARVSDARPFDAEAGLSFKYGSGESVVDDLTPWLAKRGSVGKMPPNGFPKSNRFDG